MTPVAMRREDGDLMSTFLETNSRIYDQPLRAANTEIGVEEYYILPF
jgi:hypothetical protein